MSGDVVWNGPNWKRGRGINYPPGAGNPDTCVVAAFRGRAAGDVRVQLLLLRGGGGIVFIWPDRNVNLESSQVYTCNQLSAKCCGAVAQQHEARTGGAAAAGNPQAGPAASRGAGRDRATSRNYRVIGPAAKVPRIWGRRARAACQAEAQPRPHGRIGRRRPRQATRGPPGASSSRLLVLPCDHRHPVTKTNATAADQPYGSPPRSPNCPGLHPRRARHRSRGTRSSRST